MTRSAAWLQHLTKLARRTRTLTAVSVSPHTYMLFPTEILYLLRGNCQANYLGSLTRLYCWLIFFLLEFWISWSLWSLMLWHRHGCFQNQQDSHVLPHIVLHFSSPTPLHLAATCRTHTTQHFGLLNVTWWGKEETRTCGAAAFGCNHTCHKAQPQYFSRIMLGRGRLWTNTVI